MLFASPFSLGARMGEGGGYAVAVAFSLLLDTPSKNKCLKRLWGRLVQSIGVFENMDVFSKRYMEVLAASPSDCTSLPCSCFIRNYSNATPSFSLDFKTLSIAAMVVLLIFLKVCISMNNQIVIKLAGLKFHFRMIYVSSLCFWCIPWQKNFYNKRRFFCTIKVHYNQLEVSTNLM